MLADNHLGVAMRFFRGQDFSHRVYAHNVTILGTLHSAKGGAMETGCSGLH